MKPNFTHIKAAFQNYKKQAGNPQYIAIFGKTFLEQQTKEYELTKNVAKSVVKNGFGVLHGAYTGVMKAASAGADEAIAQDSTKSQFYNIGVPMETFDQELPRASKVNLPAAQTIGDRKKALVDFCDACIVMPSGGFGTMLESLEIFHTNQLAEKFGGKIKPLIFIGSKWQIIFETLYSNLDMNKQKNGDSFCYFIDNLPQLEKILNKLKIKATI